MDSQSAQAVELIRSRMPIQDLVGRYVALKPAGKGRWKGLCPFHQEKTPSFQVDETKGLCYCFGCKSGGDIFAFLQKIESLDFRESLERLAQETGVELPQYRGNAAPKREILQVLELTQEYFKSHLSGEPLAYLQKRGLTAESVEQFGLGYAPQGWDGLLKFLHGKGVSPQEGLEAGVLMEKEGRFFDRFRNRVTFPIGDPLGRTVAFTARALSSEDSPKYLNSPETALFKKNLLLYGYPQARATIRDTGRAVVVEGLFDVIALHQMGYREAVAVLGSALSADQGLLLKRADAKDLYLSFDADGAGQKAAQLALNVSTTFGNLPFSIAKDFVVYAVSLDQGKDPGDLLLSEDGKEQYRTAIETALPEVEYRFEAAAAGLDLSRPEHKQKVLEALKPRLISNEPYDRVVQKLKEIVLSRLEISPRAFEDFFASSRKEANRRLNKPDPKALYGMARQDLTEKRILRELDIIALLGSVPDAEFESWCHYVEDHTWPSDNSLLAEFMEVARKEQGKNRVMKYFEQRGEGSKLIDALMKRPPSDHKELEMELARSMALVREVYYELRLDKLKVELKANPSVELLREISETQKAIEAERRVYKR